MTEEHVRKALRGMILFAYASGIDIGKREARGETIGDDRQVFLSNARDVAEETVMPVIADMVQEALEQGFDGRASQATPPEG